MVVRQVRLDEVVLQRLCSTQREQADEAVAVAVAQGGVVRGPLVGRAAAAARRVHVEDALGGAGAEVTGGVAGVPLKRGARGQRHLVPVRTPPQVLLLVSGPP